MAQRQLIDTGNSHLTAIFRLHRLHENVAVGHHDYIVILHPRAKRWQGDVITVGIQRVADSATTRVRSSVRHGAGDGEIQFRTGAHCGSRCYRR